MLKKNITAGLIIADAEAICAGVKLGEPFTNYLMNKTLQFLLELTKFISIQKKDAP